MNNLGLYQPQSQTKGVKNLCSAYLEFCHTKKSNFVIIGFVGFLFCFKSPVKRAFAVLAEDPGSVLRSYTGWLTPTYNSSCRGFDGLSGLHSHLSGCGLQIQAFGHMHAHEKSLETKMWYLQDGLAGASSCFMVLRS